MNLNLLIIILFSKSQITTLDKEDKTKGLWVVIINCIFEKSTKKGITFL